jgi:hypothetical protein
LFATTPFLPPFFTANQLKLRALRPTVNQPTRNPQLAGRGGNIATTFLERSGNKVHIGIAQTGGLGGLDCK